MTRPHPASASIRLLMVALLPLIASSCTAWSWLDAPPPPSADGDGNGNGDGDGDGDGGDPQPGCLDAVCVGRSGLLRLTRKQYVESVQRLVGPVGVDPNELPADLPFQGAFLANDLDLGTGDLEKYLLAAERIAGQADLGQLTSCAQASCVNGVISSWGELFHRRPLAAAEVAAYRALFDQETTFSAGARVVLESMLLSPRFLYRVEQGSEVAPGIYRLDGREVATRLALLLWQQTPDRELLAVADSGALDTAEGVEAKARAMLEDPRADEGLQVFHRQWLRTENLTLLGFSHPENSGWTAALANAMGAEVSRFAVDVFRNHGGSLQALLSAKHTFVNAPLASFYGVAPPASGWARVDDVPHRQGILLKAGVLAGNSSESWAHAVPRGLFVERALLCREIPLPGEVDRSPPDLTGIQTDRQALQRLTIDSGGSCVSCHTRINPPGFAFEQFSPMGRFRARGPSYLPDAPPTVLHDLDPSGVIVGDPVAPSALDGAFADAAELVEKLSRAQEVRACAARQWARFTLARNDGALRDEPSIRRAIDRLERSQGDLREVVVAITGSDAFRYRRSRP